MPISFDLFTIRLIIFMSQINNGIDRFPKELMNTYAFVRNQVIGRNLVELNKKSILANKSVEPLKMSPFPFYAELSQSTLAFEEYQLYVAAFFYFFILLIIINCYKKVILYPLSPLANCRNASKNRFLHICTYLIYIKSNAVNKRYKCSTFVTIPLYLL